MRRLDQEIASLRQPANAPVAPPLFLELGELFLPGPEPPRFPVDRFEAERRRWQLTLLPDRPAETPELAPDLAAELARERRTAELRARRELAEATSREQERVAEKRAEAVRARQEALNNAGLDLTARGREAIAAAQRTREVLWAEIEQETSQAQAQAQARLAEVRQRIAAETEQHLASATADARARMQKRTETAAKSGSETRNRMSKTVAPPEPLEMVQGAAWRPTDVSGGQLQPTVEPMLSADRRTREAQAARLSVGRAQLLQQAYDGVARAVLRIGGTHNWDLQLPPDGPAAGSDMTEQVRPELRRMFHPERSQ
ncbi:hypothetical protein LLH23_07395 [bacterium]|nr:hypothetical protein [bacterium]